MVVYRSNGCNGFSGAGRINPDGTLEKQDEWGASLKLCLFNSGECVFGQVVSTGMVVYAMGDRVFLKNGNQALEFRKRTGVVIRPIGWVYTREFDRMNPKDLPLNGE